MLDGIKKILNEDQDPKAIEKISEKLETILMKGEEVGYIAVQKSPVITVFPDSVVVTNKRIIVCKPKNLGLSMDVIDYDWSNIVSPFLKEGILGAEFSFITKNDVTITIDKLPKNQARRLFTFSKEMLLEIKENNTSAKTSTISNNVINEIEDIKVEDEVIDADLDFKFFIKEEEEPIIVEEVSEALEVEIIESNSVIIQNENTDKNQPKPLQNLSKDELFDKLQNYKKLLDNGLILQGEYDRLKAEILQYL